MKRPISPREFELQLEIQAIEMFQKHERASFAFFSILTMVALGLVAIGSGVAYLFEIAHLL